MMTRGYPTVCVAVALMLLTACGQPASEAPAPEQIRSLCDLELPPSTAWRGVWRTDSNAGGIKTMMRDRDWLWIATPADLVRLNLNTLDCTRFGHTDDEFKVPLKGVAALLTDPQGRLLANLGNRLVRYEAQRWQILAGFDGIGLALDNDGNLWTMTSSDTGGLVPTRYPGYEPSAPGQWKGEVIWAGPPGEGICDRWAAMGSLYGGPQFSSPSRCRLLDAWRELLTSIGPPEGLADWGDSPRLAAESGNRIWILTRTLADESEPTDVLLSFDGENWQGLPWPYGPGHLIADDARGGVWVGTKGGLVFSDGHSFQRYLLTPGDAVPTGPPVYDLVTDGSDRLWASTEQGPLLYDEASDTWQPTDTSERVLLSADDQGGLWAVSRYWGGRVSYFDGRKWTHHPFPEDWPCYPPYAILADVGGGLWLSSDECTLRGFNGQIWDEYESGDQADLLARGSGGIIYAIGWHGLGAIKRYDGTTWETILPADAHPRARVVDVVVGPEGELWVARDIAPGLLVFRNGEWKQIGEVGELPTALLVDSQGDLWIGSSAGLLHYDGRAWKTIEGAASFTSITSLAEDRGGRIWIAGEDGLSVYDPGGR